jgi:ABC-type dipeptide/oligopeptide/nickel transport system permease subunit
VSLDRAGRRAGIAFLVLLAAAAVSSLFLGDGARGAALQAALPTASLRGVIEWWLLATRNLVALIGSATLVAAVSGVALGAVSVYGGAGAAGLLSRLVEFSGAVPGLILVGLLRLADPSEGTLSLFGMLALLRTVEVAQLVRAQVLMTLPNDFVEASRAMGASRRWQWRVHIWPRLARPLVINLLVGAASLVGLEAALSFVGLGFPAATPSWGGGLAALAPGGSRLAWAFTALSIGLSSGVLYGLGVSQARVDGAPLPRALAGEVAGVK